MAAWVILAALVFVTVAPIGLRPHSFLPVQAERFVAFAVAGGLLALAYPRRPVVITLVIIALALGLELAQYAAVTRHPGVPDMLAKLAGGGCGLGGGWALNWLSDKLKRRRSLGN